MVADTLCNFQFKDSKKSGMGGGGGGGLHTLVPTPMYVCKVWGIHNYMLQIDGVT